MPVTELSTYPVNWPVVEAVRVPPPAAVEEAAMYQFEPLYEVLAIAKFVPENGIVTGLVGITLPASYSLFMEVTFRV